MQIKNNDISAIDNSRVVDNTLSTMVFTIFGKHDLMSDFNGKINAGEKAFPILQDTKTKAAKDLKTAYAMFTKSTNGVRYFIKRNGLGQLLNPLDLFEEYTHQKFKSYISPQDWRWVEVPKNVFMLYLNFLNTKNKAWLTNAERELS